jgi:ABC-type nitrate/sulfonate/bicarbonate transport system substrate-binding protein
MQLRVNVFNTSSNLPLHAALARGYFAERGLQVQVQNTPNSDAQRAGLAGGAFEIAHAAVDNAVAMVEAAGEDVVIVCGGDAGMNEFMVRSEIGSIAGVRGKLLAVDAPNTAYALVAKKILKNHGLIEQRDYGLRLAGGTGQRAAAMAADPQLAAAMINPPFSFTVLRQGLKSLGSQFTLLGPYQAVGAFVLRRWAQAHAQALEQYLAAYIEGQRYVTNPAHRAEVVDLLAGGFGLAPPVAQATYEALLTPGAGLAPDARLSPEGFAAMLGLRAELEGMWGGTAPPGDKYLDLSHYERALRTARQR